MAVLSVQKNVLAGLNPALVAAAAGGDSFPNDGKSVLIVKNGGASPCVVTVNSQELCNHGFDHDAVVSVAAGVTMHIGPFGQDRFNNSTGQVLVTYSQVTTVTVGVATLG